MSQGRERLSSVCPGVLLSPSSPHTGEEEEEQIQPEPLPHERGGVCMCYPVCAASRKQETE